MRVLKDLNVPHTKVNLPYGGIVNETKEEKGTPVTEEVLGDLLNNVYKILRDNDEIPTGTQDNDSTQYQLYDAIVKMTNKVISVERILTKTGNLYSLDMNIDKLEDKTVLFSRATDNYDSSASNKIKGTGNNEYDFVSTDFETGDSLCIIMDKSGARGYNLKQSGSTPVESTKHINCSFGTPLPYNNSDKMFYLDGNILYSSDGINIDLSVSAPTNLDIYPMSAFVYNNDILVVYFTNDIVGDAFMFYKYNANDLSQTPVKVSFEGMTMPSVTDTYNTPTWYFNDGYLYNTYGDISNHLDTVNKVRKCRFDSTTNKITFVSSSILRAFNGSSNVVFSNGKIFGIDSSGNAYRYNETGGGSMNIGAFKGVFLRLIKFNGHIYLIANETGTKWDV